MNPTNNMIELKDIKFSYKDKLILQINELCFAQNESVFLFGPSGSGKTTLLEIIAGVLAADTGQVSLLNQDLQKISPSQKDSFRAQHMGYIFQQFNLIPYLSVRENILLPFSFNKKKVDERLYIELLRTLGLEHIESQKAKHLSVGQQQRVAAARALIVQPEILLADEPTSALDYDHRENFLSLLFTLTKAQGSTLIFVSHDRSIENLFDRVIDLKSVNTAGLS